MALNSAVTVDGGEIGRSQAVQAMACGLEPHSDMNPILIKPNSDTGAQIIINGHARGNMDAVRFHEFKKIAIQSALNAYHRLCSRHDMVVVEGAGSPAEINLRENDIANMGFATAVNCPVLLAADIDRGGVFAHLTGTLHCLEKSERSLVKGFIINRFRGDRSLLDPGIHWLTRETGVATLGVLPYLKSLHIESEDSVDSRSWADAGIDRLKVIVPRIPRISNHTDLDALRLHPGVDVSYVENGRSIPACDLIVLPGSKNTISDLQWLVNNNWSGSIARHLRYGGKLLGICGGYQMIGKMIHDPAGIEGDPGSRPGLSLMDFETTLEPVKQLSRVTGTLFASDIPVQGYEIHMGITTGSDLYRPAVKLDGRNDGVVSADNQIMGTYLHGIFDNDAARSAILEWAGLKNGIEFNYDKFRDSEIDRVAAMLESEFNIEQLLEIAAGY
jgi:adenosylcobyric acid synthase